MERQPLLSDSTMIANPPAQPMKPAGGPFKTEGGVAIGSAYPGHTPNPEDRRCECSPTPQKRSRAWAYAWAVARAPTRTRTRACTRARRCRPMVPAMRAHVNVHPPRHVDVVTKLKGSACMELLSALIFWLLVVPLIAMPIFLLVVLPAALLSKCFGTCCLGNCLKVFCCCVSVQRGKLTKYKEWFQPPKSPQPDFPEFLKGSFYMDGNLAPDDLVCLEASRFNTATRTLHQVVAAKHCWSWVDSFGGWLIFFIVRFCNVHAYACTPAHLHMCAHAHSYAAYLV